MKNSTEKTIEILKSQKAMLEGHFLLSSGLHSDKYFQCALALEDTSKSVELVGMLAEKIEIPLDEIDLVAAPALGGVVVGYELARQLKKRFIFGERQNGEMTIRRGFEVKKGERVLLVEDVVTTGKSIKELEDVIAKSGGKIVAFASLINRYPQGSPFNIPYFYLLRVDAKVYDPNDCPLCKNPNFSAPYKPGSRNI